MTPAARISAAIEVLDDIIRRRRPASDALKDWGLSRRFAGSKDRAAIATLVYDALRRKASSAFAMGDESPRALVLGMLAGLRGMEMEEIAELCSGENHAPERLTEQEARSLITFDLAAAPDWVRADVPDWLWPSFAASFATEVVAEGQALAGRAPVDIRVNRLKSNRDKALRDLAHLGPEQGAWSPDAIRFLPGPDGRGPSLQTEPGFFEGAFEIQDEGSQLVTLLSGAQPGDTVIDLCAGAGGKTLALAALMQNQGRLFATDLDSRRLAPLHDRLARSGATNVEIRVPRNRGHEALSDVMGQADLVLVDAPCTGSGTWRRNPDAKWRVRPGALAERIKDQAEVLARAAKLAKPGGRIAYITCSMLPEENDGAVEAFLGKHAGFAPVPVAEVLALGQGNFALLARFATRFGLQLSPSRTATDGFYLACVERGA
ncbi:RsmB/NOP family class I SAM-dependent RNA methyltransferase [Bosea caraganae]|uniref:RsmB/NOP family class I SAM-dependent RNA methyltransferase n=1 Tax=Bosea caraganae TaxID=2763117 RepID=A0A370L1S1_9HYPH|nr:RsmB/NOP family class I SAM-dependent RNA methyltransferase [Bosea caraganae]RDJ21535.1 RsmB/NOP family class I SAM-dependent RNA methyltransferase [Bosea caraganae]RDJ23503.1 RsmB/NOP family class I SAM-dependent RNA methyltransferase [Bosea caraganae]